MKQQKEVLYSVPVTLCLLYTKRIYKKIIILTVENDMKI